MVSWAQVVLARPVADGLRLARGRHRRAAAHVDVVADHHGARVAARLLALLLGVDVASGARRTDARPPPRSPRASRDAPAPGCRAGWTRGARRRGPRPARACTRRSCRGRSGTSWCRRDRPARRPPRPAPGRSSPWSRASAGTCRRGPRPRLAWSAVEPGDEDAIAHAQGPRVRVDRSRAGRPRRCAARRRPRRRRRPARSRRAARAGPGRSPARAWRPAARRASSARGPGPPASATAMSVT